VYVVCCVVYACFTNFVPTWGYGIVWHVEFCWHVNGFLCNFHIGTERYNNERKTFAIMGLTKIDPENRLGDVRPFFGLFWGLIWTVLNGQDYIFSRKRHRPNKSVELFSQKWIICKYFSSPPPRAVSVPSHVQWVYKFKEPFEPYIETCNSF
jgi:hypothetical protein